MFMGAASFFTLMTALFIDLDFPPNGAENYKHVLIGDFFPSEIPETAYDVQVYSISGFGQGWNEAYLSYRDTPEHIAPMRRWRGSGRRNSRGRHSSTKEYECQR